MKESKQLSDIISEFSLKSFPDWNKIQQDIFNDVVGSENVSPEDIIKMGKSLRSHMNKNYFSGEWEVDKPYDKLYDELIMVAKKSLNS